MKTFSRLLIAAAVLVLAVAMFCIPASAATGRVIFIADGATGNGLSPDSPLKAETHGTFDEAAAYPKYYLNTALYQAAEMLGSEGGTIVLVGEVKIGDAQVYGSGNSQREYHFPKGVGKITMTSVWNGVDYRETNNARFVITEKAMIEQEGEMVWDGIMIVSGNSDRAICCSNYTTVVTESVTCMALDEIDNESEVPAAFPSIVAGNRYKGTKEKTDANLTVNGGTWNIVGGGQWGVNAENKFSGDSNLTMGGNIKVLGAVYGGTRLGSPQNGNVNITINGGTFLNDIYGIGKAGFATTSNTVTIKVNGGDFSEIYSISATAPSLQNNVPVNAVLDFSAHAFAEDATLESFSRYNLYTYGNDGGFNEVTAPAGYVPEEPVIQTTAPVTTEAPAPVTKPADDKKETKETKDSTIVGGPEKEFDPVIVVVIVVIAVVVIGGAAAAFIIIKKKKAAAPEAKADKPEKK